jgi:hypothetical protein
MSNSLQSIRIFGQVDRLAQRLLLQELIVDDDVMESLVRESFANYVVQTAVSFFL